MSQNTIKRLVFLSYCFDYITSYAHTAKYTLRSKCMYLLLYVNHQETLRIGITRYSDYSIWITSWRKGLWLIFKALFHWTGWLRDNALGLLYSRRTRFETIKSLLLTQHSTNWEIIISTCHYMLAIRKRLKCKQLTTYAIIAKDVEASCAAFL
jgi:hypothetical protein